MEECALPLVEEFEDFEPPESVVSDAEELEVNSGAVGEKKNAENAVRVNRARLPSTLAEAAFLGPSVPLSKLLSLPNVDVNALNSFGKTALMNAARQGHREVAQLLLEAKAVVDASNIHGITPLMHASNWGRRQMVE